jgi:hypothetical protein
MPRVGACDFAPPCACALQGGVSPTANGTVDMSSLLGMVGAPTEGCAPGYTSEACKLCVQPGFYRLGDRCLPCPNTPYAVITVFLSVFRTCVCGSAAGVW